MDFYLLLLVPYAGPFSRRGLSLQGAGLQSSTLKEPRAAATEEKQSHPEQPKELCTDKAINLFVTAIGRFVFVRGVLTQNVF